MAGTLKLSLHASGERISAFTEQSGVVIQETGSRRHKTWKRPPEFTPGWTHGPAVIVPWLSWRDELLWKYEEYPDDTEWVPEPRRSKKIPFKHPLLGRGRDGLRGGGLAQGRPSA
jgi:hypothetical protein